METQEKVVPLTREDYLSMQVADLRDGQKELRAELKDTRTELKETAPLPIFQPSVSP